MLGSGFTVRFYTDSVQAQRAKDNLISVYSRNIDKAKKFAEDYKLIFFSDDVDAVVISLPNKLHEAAVAACAKAKKHVLRTKPLGRNAAEAKRMLDMVEEAGIIGRYLEDRCYTPKFLKSVKAVRDGNIGKVLWAFGIMNNREVEQWLTWVAIMLKYSRIISAKK